MADVEKKWYVVRAISGKEGKVKEYLEAEVARLGLEHLISNVLIPMEKYYQVRNGKKSIQGKKFFPRICFD